MKIIMNITKEVLSFCLLLFVAAGCDGTIDKTFGGSDYDEGSFISQTSDDGFIITGSTGSKGAGKSDLWLLKLNNEGNIAWEKTFGGSNHDAGACVLETSDGGFIIVGRTQSFGNGGKDIWLIKTDSEGNEEWNKTYGSKGLDEGSYIIETNNGNYIVTGNFSPGKSTSTVGTDIFVMMVNNTGDRIWSKTFGGDHELSDDYGVIVKIVTDDDLIVLGVLNDFLSNEIKGLIIKLDQDGNTLWDKKLDNLWPKDIIVDSDGNYLISGTLNDNLFILKLGRTGERLDSAERRNNSIEKGGYIWQMDDKGYILAGSTDGHSNGKLDAIILKTDALNNSVWEKYFGGSSNDKINSGVLTKEGYLALTGYTESNGAGKTDLWFLKIPVK